MFLPVMIFCELWLRRDLFDFDCIPNLDRILFLRTSIVSIAKFLFGKTYSYWWNISGGLMFITSLSCHSRFSANLFMFIIPLCLSTTKAFLIGINKVELISSTLFSFVKDFQFILIFFYRKLLFDNIEFMIFNGCKNGWLFFFCLK